MNTLNKTLEKLVRLTLGTVMFVSTLIASIVVMPFYIATLVITVFQKPSQEMVYAKVPVNENR